MNSENSSSQYPLFPLSQPLFPQQVIPLKIFEARYLDLVSRCLKEQTTFGVVQIREGREVGQPALTYQIGVEARIVDWNQMPNGLLGIQIQGERKFRVESTEVSSSKLSVATVHWLAQEPSIPIADHFDGLVQLLEQLRRHPVVQQMGLPDISDSRALGWQLTQLLPMSTPERMQLLAQDDPILRLEQLALVVERLSEGDTDDEDE